jgi:hypothetical protein
MRIDFSSTAATAVVAAALSFTLWWQFRKLKQPADPVTAQSGGKNCKENVHEISVKEEETGQEQKWISKATITVHMPAEPSNNKKDNSSCMSATMASPDSATEGLANSAAKKGEEEPDLKVLKNFTVMDIPDFTIELADSDDDMF